MESASRELPAYSTSMLLRDLWQLLQPYKYRYALATVLRAAGDIVKLYPAYAIATIVSMLGNASSTDMFPVLARLILFAGIAHVFYVLCREGAKYLGYQVSERLSLDVQVQTLRHLFRLDLLWHERENSGNKLKRMQKGGDGVKQILHIWLTNMIEVSVNFIGITVIIAAFDRGVALLMLGFMLVYYIASVRITRKAVRAQHNVNIGEEEFDGLAFEAVNNIRTVKVLGMAGPLLGRTNIKASNVFSFIRQRIFWYRLREMILATYGYVFFLCVVSVIAWGILNARYDVSFLVLFVQYFIKIWENTEELARVTQDFMAAKVGVGRMMLTLREPLGIDDDTGKQTFPADWKSIEIKNIRFEYRKDNPVLHDISLTIRRGERVGIVGVSGAGKSTLFKLLLKEHEHYQGGISIGGIPLRQISRSSYFMRSAVVLQDTEVFNFSLKDNITLANPGEEHNANLLKQSLETAHVSDFIHKLRQGLETFIGEKGVKLSGGEKQRVGIARAVFKQPEILFLDEATSHLDVESEEKIRDSLHTMFQNVTAIVIAHRLSTIKEMDRIVVMENGRIIEQGPFEELYAKKGRFWELWEKQKF